jgi:hypothetical protein
MQRIVSQTAAVGTRQANRQQRVTILCLLCLCSCAMGNPDNRRLLNLLDARLIPTSNTGRLAMLPVALPTALAALVADAALLHPTSAVDDAWGDTREFLWTPTADESAIRRAVKVPLAAVATPAVFVGDWLWRCLFDVDPRIESTEAS